MDVAGAEGDKRKVIFLGCARWIFTADLGIFTVPVPFKVNFDL